MSDSNPPPANAREAFAAASAVITEEEARQILADHCGADQELADLLLRMWRAHRRGIGGSLEQASSHLAGFTHVVAQAADALRQQGLPEMAIPEIDGFTNLELIGEGAMGCVYRALQDPPLRREVAVKVLKPGLDLQRLLARFEREQLVMALMDHPHIARVYEAGATKRGLPYFAMELIEGEAIDVVCAQQSLSIEARLALIIEACRAVSHAHKKGIAHRDLKPANLLVTVINGVPQLKIIDFGVAKAIRDTVLDEPRLTTVEAMIGTPLYMSPEQLSLDRAETDERSDVYALGAVLYKLLTGYAPREPKAETSSESPRRLLRGSIPSLVNRLQQGPAEESMARLGIEAIDLPFWFRRCKGALERVVQTALRDEPSARYPSADAFAEDLQRVLSGHRWLSWRAMTGRLTRTERSSLAALAIAAIFIIVALGLWGFDRHQQGLAAKQQALREAQLAADHQEASVLQNMLRAVREDDLMALSRYKLPRDKEGNFLTSDEPNIYASMSPDVSLRRLLTRLADPQPDWEIEHPANVLDMDIDAQERWVATACADGKVRIWSADNGEFAGELGPVQGEARAVAINPQGTILACGDGEGFLTLWKVDFNTKGDLLLPEEPYSRGVEHDEGVESMVFDDLGKLLAVAHRYGPVIIYDTAGNELHSYETERATRNESVAFLSDSKHLLRANSDAISLDIIEVETGAISERFRLKHSVVYPRAFTFLGNNELYLFHTCHDLPHLGWTITGDGYTTDSIGDLSEIGLSITSSPEGDRLIVGHASGRVSILAIHIRNNDPEVQPKFSFDANRGINEQGILDIEWLSQDSFLTCGDKIVRRWTIANIQPWSIHHVPQTLWASQSKDGMAFTDGLLLDDNYVRYFNLKARIREPQVISIPTLQQASFKNGEFAPTRSGGFVFSLSESGDHLAISTVAGIFVADVPNRTWLPPIKLRHPNTMQVAISSESRCVAATFDDQLLVWKYKDGWLQPPSLAGQYRVTLDSTDPKLSLIEFIGEGSLLALHTSQACRFFDVESGEILATHTIDPTSKAVHCSLQFHEQILALPDLNSEFKHLTTQHPFLRDETIGQYWLIDGGRIALIYRNGGNIEAIHLPTGAELGEIYCEPYDIYIHNRTHVQRDQITLTTFDRESHNGRIAILGQGNR